VAIKSSRGIAGIDITCRIPREPNSTDSRVIAPASGTSVVSYFDPGVSSVA
jgi:hypothetical protein